MIIAEVDVTLRVKYTLNNGLIEKVGLDPMKLCTSVERACEDMFKKGIEPQDVAVMDCTLETLMVTMP